MKSFYIYQTGAIRFHKASYDIIKDANPKEQAELLCYALATSVPTNVCEEFAKIVGVSPANLMNTLVQRSQEPVYRKAPRKRTARAKLTPDKVVDIFTSQTKAGIMAEIHNVSVHTVYAVRGRRSWQHITNELNRPHRKCTPNLQEA